LLGGAAGQLLIAVRRAGGETGIREGTRFGLPTAGKTSAMPLVRFAVSSSRLISPIRVQARSLISAKFGLLGCSIRTAQLLSKPLRRDMLAKRDRLIAHMHREGRTQDAIADALEVPQKTISDVIARFSGKRSDAGTAKPAPPPRSRPEAPEPAPAIIPPGQRDPAAPPRRGRAA